MLGLKAKLLLYLDLYPETLRVEAVAVVGVAALHCVILDIGILKCSSPGVMYSHGVVGGYRTVDKAVLGSARVLCLQLLEAIVFLPEAKYLFFIFHKGILCFKLVLHIFFCPFCF